MGIPILTHIFQMGWFNHQPPTNPMSSKGFFPWVYKSGLPKSQVNSIEGCLTRATNLVSTHRIHVYHVWHIYLHENHKFEPFMSVFIYLPFVPWIRTHGVFHETMDLWPFHCPYGMDLCFPGSAGPGCLGCFLVMKLTVPRSRRVVGFCCGFFC